MKKSKSQLILALLAALLGLVSLSGLTFSRMQEKPERSGSADEIRVELHWEGQEKVGSIPVLEKHSVVSRRLYAENTGELPCYIRVKLYMPQVDGSSLFELGELSGDVFFQKDGKATKEKEYWEKIGEYFYYRNARTQNLLLPGDKTASLFSALQVSTKLRGMPSSQMEAEVIAWAQAAKPEEGVDECQIWRRGEQ